MRRTTLTICLTALFVAALMLSGCSKPWSHPGYSGAAAKTKFKDDSLACKVIAGEEFPLDKRKQDKRFEGCMAEKGWQNDRDNPGYRFTTDPR